MKAIIAAALIVSQPAAAMTFVECTGYVQDAKRAEITATMTLRKHFATGLRRMPKGNDSSPESDMADAAHAAAVAVEKAIANYRAKLEAVCKGL